MREHNNLVNRIDWGVILLYFLLVGLGWLNIFAVVYDAQNPDLSIFDTSINSGRQLIWIGTSAVLFFIIMLTDFRFYDSFAYFIYGGIILILTFVLLFGTEVAGSKSWFSIGSFRLQPSEFAKFATALAVAKFISSDNKVFSNIKSQLILFVIIGLPAILIILQGDTGTAMVFSAFLVAFYREGFSPLLLGVGIAAAILFVLTLFVPQLYMMIAVIVTAFLLIGINARKTKRIIMIAISAAAVMLVIFSVDFIITDVLKPHQQNRIKALINPEADPLGYGWNVTQSKIAIGSGGMWGKGFLEGTQTKFDFVPEQSTDFIFCTIGEEHGWFGSLILIVLFVALLIKVTAIAERQKATFARVYGYSVAGILFFHFSVNIGMTIGLFPVIGIPLPFFSYGGSSLWAFTILLFILVKLDAHRMQILTRS
ncbi:rod shape-determining protein RodA [Porifericola rhodea]|uniref:rod shape-determining protein RodA n=1 Tax=Porifericola rhodea TaxID=930972 RepID=UPI002665DB58|nr:rod shape-determining protein RodA [Porifericola rhodea]WKN33462.1 rod shape-determining protein RodA [Porifericola rhodea]